MSLPSASSRSAATSLRTICSGLCRFLVAMILSSLPAHIVGRQTLINHGSTDRGQATATQTIRRFAVEAKYDGQRGIAIVEAGTVKLLSRNGADITHNFPEITAALPAMGRSAVLDGEIVALDGTGVRSFGGLQRRWPQKRRPIA